MPDIGRPVAGAIAVVLHGAQVLLVRRHRPPDLDLWGYPGGKIERGETIMDAATRELYEETGITGRPRCLLAPLDVLRHAGGGELIAHFILLPVLCDWAGGVACAASDARDAAWFRVCELEQRRDTLSPQVVELARQAVAASESAPM